MSSSIVLALPSVHGSLLGIGLSLFAVFAIYVYQRTQENLDEFDLAIRRAHTITEPFYWNLSLMLIPEKEKFELVDFERFIYKILIPMFKREDWRDKREDAEMHAYCYGALTDIVQWFYSITLHYPRDKEIERYSAERLDGMRNQLSSLWYLWQKHERDIRDLAILCERPDAFDKSNEEVMMRFFSKMQEYRFEIIPAMIVCVHRHEQFTKRYDLNHKMPYAMWGIAFVFLLGIIAPLILGDYEERYCQLSYIWSYALLVLSFLPYVISWYFFLPKRKKQ